MDLSIVIPYVHSYPEIIQTLFAFQNELIDENYTFEIIIVENREVDPYTNRFLHYFRVPRSREFIRYFFEEVPCGPAARMKGAVEARGKYLMFCDAHTQPGKNTLPLLVDLLEGNSNVGSVHGSTMYSHVDLKRGAGCHYDLFGGDINLRSHFHGRYQRCKCLEPYRVAGASLAYMMVRREEFLALRGYHPECRGYPHPEGYVPLKYQMCGLECWSVPSAWHLHSLYPRNYGTRPKVHIEIEGEKYLLVGNDNLVRNAMICAGTLGGEEWVDKVYEEWRGRGGHKRVLDGIRVSAESALVEERDWVLDNSLFSLDEVLDELYDAGVKGMEKWKS